MTASKAKRDESRSKSERVFALIKAAAEYGAPCPKNGEIAAAIGLSSPSAVSGHISLLVTAGLITVERGNSSRVVTIVKTGKRTAGSVVKPHWREREHPPIKPAVASMAKMAAATSSEDLLEELTVEASRAG